MIVYVTNYSCLFISTNNQIDMTDCSILVKY